MTTTAKTNFRMIIFYTKKLVKELISTPKRDMRASKYSDSVRSALAAQRVFLAEKELEYGDALSASLDEGGN